MSGSPVSMYVYGHSDDLIEVEGDVRKEFNAYDTDGTHIMLGETEVVAEYDGEWHFAVVDRGEHDEAAWYSVGRKEVVEKLNDYTECIVVESPTATACEVDV